MQNDFNEKCIAEFKLITKYILLGFSSGEIAKKLNYSRSTISNRISSLFGLYGAKTRMEFAVKFFLKCINTKMRIINENEIKINRLSENNKTLFLIVSGLVKNRTNIRKFNFWFKEAENCLKKISTY